MMTKLYVNDEITLFDGICLYLFQASPVSKLNFSIKTKKYQNENKTFAVSLKSVVSKQNNTFDTTI